MNQAGSGQKYEQIMKKTGAFQENSPDVRRIAFFLHNILMNNRKISTEYQKRLIYSFLSRRQKGRCRMKWFSESKIRLVSLGFVVAIMLNCSGTVNADFAFGTPINLGPNMNSPVEDLGVCISPNGLELYFCSFFEGFGVPTFRMASRENPDDPWGEVVNFDPPFKRIVASCISSDGLCLYFDSDRPGGSGGADIWMATRTSMSDSWSNPVDLGDSVNSPAWDLGPSVSGDGLELYFGSARPGGSGDWDVWMCARETLSDSWSTAVNLGPTVNSSEYDGHPFISTDGLALFITSARAGGHGDWDIWFITRATRDDDWGEPVNLGPSLNTSAGEAEPSLSDNGRMLYFSDWWVPRPGGVGKNDIWQAPIIPIVDFNGDGIVDCADMCILVNRWGTDDSSFDVGPMPWGDGTVDVHDLTVLTEYLFEPVVDPTLVTHWPLDETEGMVVTDSAADNNGYAMGNPIWLPDGGQVDGALEFDGIDDFISAPAPLNPADGPFSVLIWVKGGAAGQTIISETGGPDWLSLDPQTGFLKTELKSAGRNGVTLLSQTAVDDGNWHWIGLVWDGSNRILSVDNAIAAQDTQDDLQSACGSLYIGCGDPLLPGSFFSGLIDEVRNYNRAIRP